MARIVHIVSMPSGLGGAERIVNAISRAQPAGWSQVVINISGRNSELAALYSSTETVYREIRSNVPVFGVSRATSMILADLRPDIVHAHLPKAMLVLAILGRKGRYMQIATHHHGDHLFVSRRRLATWVDRFAGARFDLLVTPSEAVRRFLIETYDYRPDAVRAITNGWAGEPFPPDDTKMSIDPTVVSVANFRPEKNHELLIKAFALVHKEMPRARLLLVGGGSGEAKVCELIRKYGLESAVELTGPVDNVWPYLSRSHLFVLSSNYETLGIAALEAMAAGLPVVATAVGGLPELVEPGVNGELVEPGNHFAMAEAIKGILGSDELIRSMGAAGQKTAAQHTAERMVDRYFSLYSELIEGAS